MGVDKDPPAMLPMMKSRRFQALLRVTGIDMNNRCLKGQNQTLKEQDLRPEAMVLN